VNLPVLVAGIAGLLASAVIVSHVVTSRAHDERARIEYNRALHRRAGNYVRR
jgi:hypothetical protein